MNFRATPLLLDIGGILALAAVALGLGLFARSHPRDQQRQAGKIMDASVLPHPVLTLAQFRLAVDTRQSPILDARTRSAYELGHVPRAWSVPSVDFDQAYEKLPEEIRNDKDRLLIVYCSDLWCELGDELQQKLINRGHHHVGRFPEGWIAWLQHGGKSTRE